MDDRTRSKTAMLSETQKMIIAITSMLLLMIAFLLLLINMNQTLSHVETQLQYQPPTLERAETGRRLAKNQSLYVPVYSHVYVKDGKPFRLTATLSIRNTDPDHPLVVDRVLYYDSAGKLVRTYVNESVSVAPHATIEFLVEEGDTSGGSGANFVVEWASDNPLTQPVVEAVMIGTSDNQGISFVCPAVVVTETLGGGAATEARD